MFLLTALNCSILGGGRLTNRFSSYYAAHVPAATIQANLSKSFLDNKLCVSLKTALNNQSARRSAWRWKEVSAVFRA
jgi:hypothetical protein